MKKINKPIILIDPFPRSLNLIFSKKNLSILKKNFTLIDSPKNKKTTLAKDKKEKKESIKDKSISILSKIKNIASKKTK